MSSEEKRRELKEAILKNSYKENHEDPFQLASGKKSPYYLDLKATLLRPRYLQMAAELMLEDVLRRLPVKPDAVAGLTMGADPLLYAISLIALQQDMNIVPLVVRKQEKGHGSKKRVEGIVSPNIPVVLIDDVITTGGSTLKADDALREAGIHSNHAFCVVDRNEGGRENLNKQKIQLHSLYSLEEFCFTK